MAGNLTAMIASIFSGGVTADPYFEYTTLLLPGSGTNGAQNNTFLDSGTANGGVGFPITRNGNTTQGTFSPFSQTGWGNYFNGNSYLSAGTTLFNYTTGNASTTTFTIEAFIYLNSYQTTANVYHNPCIIGKGDVYLNLGVNGSGNLTFYHYDGTVRSITGSSIIPLTTWTYVAVTVTGGTATLYVNGTSVGSGTWYGIQAAGQNTTSLIGRASTNASSLYINGYISNLRVSTVARTIATPTTAYTNDANTALLTAQSNRFIDNSSSPITLTVTGSPTVVAFSPFNPTASWSAATNGGSGYFDGSGDYLSVANSTSLQLSNADWTIECWVYVTSTTGNQRIISQSDSNYEFAFYMASGALTAYSFQSAGTQNFAISMGTLVVNQWYHIAATRSGSTIRAFVNGSQVGSATFSGTIDTRTGGWKIGSSYTGTENFSGYITDSRIVKGTAVYTAAFTPPTAPLTAITNTSLLLNFTNAGIYDATSKNDLETVGNAQISNTTAKFGSTSMSFDGTDDRLTNNNANNPLISLGTGDFTIEGWIYANTVAGERGFLQISDTVGGLKTSYTTGIHFALGASPYRLNFNVGGTDVSSGSTYIAINTWYHIAATRSSGSVRLFINGTLVGGPTTVTTDLTGQYICVGGYYNTSFLWNGYIQDLRITKGYARYTSNFTAPTAAFPTL
jgi:hypothetical protein